ncbi:MAG: hypothetical protein ACR2QE_17505 [Acidimicrobiales bacterium]
MRRTLTTRAAVVAGAIGAGAMLIGGCASDEPERTFGADVETSTTLVEAAATTTTTTTDEQVDGFASLPTEPVTVLAGDGSIVTVDATTGEQVDVLLEPASPEEPKAVSMTQDPDGRWFVTTADAETGCGASIHMLVDGELRFVRTGHSPVFATDGSKAAFLDDGHARFGEPQPLSWCVYDTIVVEDRVAGREWLWRHEVPDDLDLSQDFALEDWYQLGGTPGTLDFSPDSHTLAFGIYGEGFVSYTLDLTVDQADPQQLSVSDEAAAALDEVLPNGYGLSHDGWTGGGDLVVVAFSYHWDGWAEAVAVDGVVTEVTSASADRLPPTPLGSRDGFDLVIDWSGDESRLVVVAADGSERELATGVRAARW